MKWIRDKGKCDYLNYSLLIVQQENVKCERKKKCRREKGGFKKDRLGQYLIDR
jgi:hypothetical protein